MNMNKATQTQPQTQTEAARLYAAFATADAAFQAQLVKDHGKRAGDIRYQPTKQSVECRLLGDSYRSAGMTWHDEIARVRRIEQVPFVDINWEARNAEIAHALIVDAMKRRLDEAETKTEDDIETADPRDELERIFDRLSSLQCPSYVAAGEDEGESGESGESEGNAEGFTDEQLVALGLRDAEAAK